MDFLCYLCISINTEAESYQGEIRHLLTIGTVIGHLCTLPSESASLPLSCHNLCRTHCCQLLTRSTESSILWGIDVGLHWIPTALDFTFAYLSNIKVVGYWPGITASVRHRVTYSRARLNPYKLAFSFSSFYIYLSLW